MALTGSGIGIHRNRKRSFPFDISNYFGSVDLTNQRGITSNTTISDLSGVSQAAIRFLFKPEVTGNGAVFFAFIASPIFRMRWRNTVGFDFALRTNAGNAIMTWGFPTLGESYDVCVTYDGGSATLYINGVSIDTATSGTALNTSTDDIFFNGIDIIQYKFADLSIWAGGLPTPTEISNLASRTIDIGGVTTQPTYHFPLNKRSTETISTTAEPETLDRINQTVSMTTDQAGGTGSMTVWSDESLYAPMTSIEDPAKDVDFTGRVTSGNISNIADWFRNSLVVACGDSFGVTFVRGRMLQNFLCTLRDENVKVKGIAQGALVNGTAQIQATNGSTGGTFNEVQDESFSNGIELAADGDSTTRRYGLPISGIHEFFGVTPGTDWGGNSRLLSTLTAFTSQGTAPRNTALKDWIQTGDTIKFRPLFYRSGQSEESDVAVRFGTGASDVQEYDLSSDLDVAGGSASTRVRQIVGGVPSVTAREINADERVVQICTASSGYAANSYIHNAGGVFYKENTEGIIWATLAASSANFSDFSTSATPNSDNSKRFTDEQLRNWLQAVYVDDSQNITVILHLALEDLSQSEYETQFKNTLDRFQDASNEVCGGANVSVLMMIPHFHEVTGVNDIEDSRKIFEDCRAACIQVASERANFAWYDAYSDSMGAAFLREMTDGQVYAFSGRGYGEGWFAEQVVIPTKKYENRDPYGTSINVTPDVLDDGALHVKGFDDDAVATAGVMLTPLRDLIETQTNNITADLSEISGLLANYDASDTSTITTSGNAVTTLRPAQGTWGNLVQSTSISRPTSGVSTQNGLNILTFDGNDFLENLSQATTPSLTAFIVADVDAINNQFDGLLSGTGTNDFQLDAGSGAFRARLRGTSFTDATTSDGPYTDWAVFVVRFDADANTGTVFVNDFQKAIATDYNTDLDASLDWRLFANRDGTQYPDGKFGQLVIYDNALHRVNISKVVRFLRDKWGI